LSVIAGDDGVLFFLLEERKFNGGISRNRGKKKKKMLNVQVKGPVQKKNKKGKKKRQMRVRSVSCLAVERLQAKRLQKPTALVACVKHAEVQIPPHWRRARKIEKRMELPA